MDPHTVTSIKPHPIAETKPDHTKYTRQGHLAHGGDQSPPSVMRLHRRTCTLPQRTPPCLRPTQAQPPIGDGSAKTTPLSASPSSMTKKNADRNALLLRRPAGQRWRDPPSLTDTPSRRGKPPPCRPSRRATPSSAGARSAVVQQTRDMKTSTPSWSTEA